MLQKIDKKDGKQKRDQPLGGRCVSPGERLTVGSKDRSECVENNI